MRFFREEILTYKGYAAPFCRLKKRLGFLGSPIKICFLYKQNYHTRRKIGTFGTAWPKMFLQFELGWIRLLTVSADRLSSASNPLILVRIAIFIH